MSNQLHDQIVREIRKRVGNGEGNQVLQALHTCNANSLDDVDEADYPRLLDLLQQKGPPEAPPVPEDVLPETPNDPMNHLSPEEGIPEPDTASDGMDNTPPSPVPVPDSPQEPPQRTFPILCFKNRREKKGIQENVGMTAFINEFQKADIADITLHDYLQRPEAERAMYKDHGMYLMGKSTDGTRKSESITSRSGITLDLDRAPKDIDKRLQALPFFAIYHPTFKSTPEAPRIRVNIPFKRDVTVMEFNVIVPEVGKLIGEEYVDRTSYKPTQAMYFPVVPKDSTYWCKHTSEPLLDPDLYLNSSGTSPNAPSPTPQTGQMNAKDKSGWIGAYNSAYPPKDLLNGPLADRYEPTSDPNRYHYRGADSSAGLVVYDDGYVCSFHASDPAHGSRLCSFDLARIHLFGHLDQGLPANTPINKFPSQKAMLEYAKKDPKVQQAYQAQNTANIGWMKKLKKGRKGEILSSLENASIILLHDPLLSSIRYDLFSGRYEADHLPWNRHTKQWTKLDWSNLRCYMEKAYGFFGGIETAFYAVIPSQKYYHSVQDYILAQVWDGKKRIDTLLIDYLGAEDNAYVRAVTSKPLIALVGRMFRSSVKFDYMPVICGPQGIGKSTLLSKLAIRPEWFTDSVSISDMQDVKKAGEKIQGKLIVEISELQGMQSAKVENVKGFLSSIQDNYRQAYDTNAVDHPRTCIFWGTTNNSEGYLRDITGNRRFWPINVTGNGTKSVWDLDEATIGQIYAEAKVRFDQGEELYLSGEIAKTAERMQSEAMERSPSEEFVMQYLDTPLPEGWQDMTPEERRIYLANPEGGTVMRDRVSVAEIYCECLSNADKPPVPRRIGNEIRSVLRIHSDEWELHTSKNGKPSAQERKPYGKQIVYYRIHKNERESGGESHEEKSSK